MKKILVMLSIFVFSASFLYAAEIEREGTPARKLQRGFVNIVLSPLEISNELAKEIKNDTMPPSWAIGFGRGAIFTVGRALAGVYDMITFPIPYPAEYKPIINPEFPWQHLPPTEE